MECWEERLDTRDCFNCPSGACGWPWVGAVGTEGGTRVKARETLRGVARVHSAAFSKLFNFSVPHFPIYEMGIIQGYCEK